MTKIKFVDATKKTESIIHGTELEQLIQYTLQPMRRRRTYHGQPNITGFYWFQSINQHVWHESKLERTHLIGFDFEQSFSAVVSQPFAVITKKWTHTPDFLMRNKSGKITIVNVKPVRFAQQEKFLEQSLHLEELCLRTGWIYQLCTDQITQRLKNIVFLAGFRRSQNWSQTEIQAVFEAIGSTSIPLDELVRKFNHQWQIKPLIFYLIWLGQLQINLEQQLNSSMMVWRD